MPGHPTRFTLAVVDRVCAGDGVLFGGTMMSVLVSCAEALTDGADVLSLAVQFVAPARTGDQLEVDSQVERLGRRVTQIRLAGRVAGQLVANALASLGRPGRWTFVDLRRPTGVPPPDDCEPRTYRLGGPDSVAGLLDVRRVPATTAAGEADSPGRRLLWGRVPGCTGHTAASLALLADHVPFVATQALAPLTRATTVAGALFAPRRSPHEWVLLDVRVDVADATVCCGGALIWSPEGTFLGRSEQTLLIAP